MSEERKEQGIEKALREGRISRREFLRFCTVMAATLAMPSSFVDHIARALTSAKRLPVVWLEYQDCAGCTESFLRANQPTVAELVLDVLSVNYHETIMAPSGQKAEKSLHDTIAEGGYLVVVEGAIPTADDGVYCCIGGRSALDLIREVASRATAIITVGACAFYGGWPATTPNPTGARGVKDVVSGVPILNLPGCPMNVDNFTATVVHYLTTKRLPATDDLGRPLFAYGRRIHDNCERRGHFDAGEFVRQWGDEGHRKGWCLYPMGCKGPVAFQNCPTIRWNQGTSWPVGAGHGCIACAAPDFWERPAYETVPIQGLTPPTTYPPVEGAVEISPVTAGIVGAAVGVAVGAAGAVAARKLTEERVPEEESK